MSRSVPWVNYTSVQYPYIKEEHLVDAIDGKLCIQWDGEPLIKPFGPKERARLREAMNRGWVLVEDEDDSVSRAFFQRHEYAKGSWVRVKKSRGTAEVSLDLLPTGGRHLTIRGAERVWKLCQPLLKDNVSLIINDWTILDPIPTSKAPQIADGFVAIYQDAESTSTANLDLGPTIDRLFATWQKAKEASADLYEAHLHSPKWRQLRAEVLERAGNRCQLCGATGVTLFGHHNTYLNLGDEQPGDVIALCRDCHAIGDQRRRERRDGPAEN